MLPFMKLGSLAIRTISKPIANRLKTHASAHPWFRSSIIWMAQKKYRWATQLQRRLRYGRAVNVAIRPLDEARAIAAATTFLGEVVIFTVAGLVILYEVNKSYKSEANEEASKQARIRVICDEEEGREFTKRSRISKAEAATDGETYAKKKYLATLLEAVITSPKRSPTTRSPKRPHFQTQEK